MRSTAIPAVIGIQSPKRRYTVPSPPTIAISAMRNSSEYCGTVATIRPAVVDVACDAACGGAYHRYAELYRTEYRRREVLPRCLLSE